jgi:type II secretory pathway pseudopilin PulG
MPARPTRHHAHRADGFSLLELAVVVCVLGVLGIAMTSAYASYAQDHDRGVAQADAELARQALRAFAARNQRLPCPDSSGSGDNGREAGGGTCAASAQSGWLPYLDLDLELPTRGRRIRYGVYRATGADLVQPGDGSGVVDIDGQGAFRRALAAVAAATASTDHPFHGSVTSSGEPACTQADSNPAFVLVVPLQDQDGTAGAMPGFDGANRGFGDGTSLCTAPPDQPRDAHYDDVVATEGATTLLGWVARQSR